MIELRREVVNYVELRWSDGFAPVSQATGGLAAAFERLAASSSPARGRARVEVTTLPIDGERVSVGVVRFDLLLSSGPRELRYFHAAAFPAHQVSESAWRAMVEERYGESIEDAIRELYERAAVTPRGQGAELAEARYVRDADVRMHAGPPRSLSGQRAVVKIDDEVHGAARRPAGVRWLLAAVALLVAAVVALLVMGRGDPPSNDAELQRLRTQVRDLERARDAVEAQRLELDRQLQTRSTELTACEARTTKACDGYLIQLDKARGDVETITRDRDALAERLTRAQTSLARTTTERDAAITERDQRGRRVDELRDSLRTACASISGLRPAVCKRIP